MKKYLKQLKANKKGFTLIEMIVVIGIIGILAAILVPSISGYLRNAKNTKKEANARTVYTAAQAAVTSLETTTPVIDGEYDNKGTNVSGDTDGKIKKALFSEIESLIGKSNYGNFDKITVEVDKGAVISVAVTETGETTVTTYPEKPQVSDSSEEGSPAGDSSEEGSPASDSSEEGSPASVVQ